MMFYLFIIIYITFHFTFHYYIYYLSFYIECGLKMFSYKVKDISVCIFSVCSFFHKFTIIYLLKHSVQSKIINLPALLPLR